MKSYRFNINLKANAEALSLEDALQAIEDCFGPGEAGPGIEVLEFTAEELDTQDE